MKEIVLTQGKVTIVDDEDYDWLNQWKWSARKATGAYTFYALRNSKYVRGKKRHIIFMHRAILNTPDGMRSDHKDMDGLNNQRKNLRIATCQQNLANRILRIASTSKYKGVHMDKETGKWRASITFNGKKLNIGRFVDEVDAAMAYDKKAVEVFGNFAHLNFNQ